MLARDQAADQPRGNDEENKIFECQIFFSPFVSENDKDNDEDEDLSPIPLVLQCGHTICAKCAQEVST
jgi:hypothetical protein